MARGITGPVIIIPGTANNMTGTAVVTSKVMNVQLMTSMAIQAVWTGTPVGAFSVQGSLDYTTDASGAILNPGTWTSMGISVTAPAGSASNALVDITLTAIPYIRLVYTNASGTGTLTVMASLKGV